jgi:hypothetical protein
MCFDKEVSNYTHKVAEEDIVCYKVVFRYESEGKPRWSSLYQHFIYEQGELYEEKFSDRLLRFFDGLTRLKSNVYHSYSDLCGIDVIDSRWLGTHQAVLVKCIIPKGSIYWVNEHEQQYASNAIKIVREEPFWKD